MKICGIVAEYNPFHSGHAYQIEKTRQILGDDTAIVCVMSGNFVQRGECAIMDKHARAKAAILCGADVVIELPTVFALASAEKFAFGAVSILERLGNVTDLSFGSETADISAIMEIAQILLEHETVALTLENMKDGISYAAARERALYSRIKEKSEILKEPNNILGIEYCKALLKLKSKIKPLAIMRTGAGHNGFCEGDTIQSASHIRGLIYKDRFDEAESFMPRYSAEILKAEIDLLRAPTRLENGDRAVLSYLRRLKIEDIARLEDCSEGLEHRLFDAIQNSYSIDEIIDRAKTKRYARSRIARMIMRLYIGVWGDEICEVNFARVLGFSRRGRAVLKSAKIPMIVKSASYRNLGEKDRGFFERECLRSDMIADFAPDFGAVRRGSDYVTSPFYGGDGKLGGEDSSLRSE